LPKASFKPTGLEISILHHSYNVTEEYNVTED